MMRSEAALVLTLSLCGNGLPVLAVDFTQESALQYLQQFGHINPVTESPVFTTTTTNRPAFTNRPGVGHFPNGEFPNGEKPTPSDKIEQYLRDFQAYTGLPQTGTLDTATVNLMKSPRCGVVDDVVKTSFNSRSSSRYGKWQKKELTYRVVKYSTKISNTAVDRVCRKAMDMWEGAAHIKFIQQTSGKADIEILFGSRQHGDNKLGLRGRSCGGPFDGPGAETTVLAHAFYPRVRGCKQEVAGDVHIDDDEDWSETLNDGLDLLHTVTHEVGHSLGLGHSSGLQGTIMHPHHPGWVRNLKLHADDVKRIQRLYGKPQRKTTAPTPTPHTCVCDTFTRFDPKRNKRVGNCKTTFKGKAWCYIKKTTDCPDSKSSSTVDNFNWSKEACKNINQTPPPTPGPTPPPTQGPTGFRFPL